MSLPRNPNHKYLFDVKLFASLRIEAQNREEAEAKIKEFLNCAKVTLDTEDGAELVEIDGEPA